MVSTAWQVAGGVLALGVALYLLDRTLLWMEARGWVYWRRRKGLSSIGVDFLQEGDPGARAVRNAMEQERVRKNVRPAEGPPGQVDLESGVVRFRSTASEAGSRAPDAGSRAEPSGTEGALPGEGGARAARPSSQVADGGVDR
ncbi:hypothetical protein [Streptomyces albipurpureus]|uniref:Uncharacterized protein n=1 Tax=Streptomyces albipurpureus TaxID=2897419 RepID=A0ABT0UST8_9ACTN|nr:hypothetical protein [Streptomyces sp. CWNU-1]MCM2390296.1 hypothetical protein [Streptomyces sp. CWNU-1]